MKHLVLIGFFVLILQAAALASTLDFSNHGLIGTTASISGDPTSGTAFSVTDQLASALGTVTLTTSGLTLVQPGEFTFSGGTVEVLSNSSQVLFQDTFGTGTLIDIGGDIILSSSPGIGGTSVQVVISGRVVKGTVTLVPEPTTISLLGTGLLGVAAILRRSRRGLRRITTGSKLLPPAPTLNNPR